MRIKFNIQSEVNKELTIDQLKTVLFKSMIKMHELAAINCPVDTGRLRNSINLKPSTIGYTSYTLSDGTDYGVDVEYGCFFGNSHKYKILTKRGYKFLRDVKINDLVLTHEKRWKKVIGKPEYCIKKQIPRYTIKTTSGKKVTVTEEHPFFTKRGWIRAKNLIKEDILIEVV